MEMKKAILSIPPHNYETRIVLPEYGIIIPYVILHQGFETEVTLKEIDDIYKGLRKICIPYSGGYVPYIIPQTGEQHYYYLDAHVVQL
jgi:hypothetical protein